MALELVYGADFIHIFVFNYLSTLTSLLAVIKLPVAILDSSRFCGFKPLLHSWCAPARRLAELREDFFDGIVDS
jgi:hypothetical protein